MKHSLCFLLFLFGCFVFASVSALDVNVVTQIQNEGPSVWGIDNSPDKFVPKRTALKVCIAQNIVLVGFYLSRDNIDFYRQTFADGKRKPIGFELDVHDRSRAFSRNDIRSVSLSSVPYYSDSYFEDRDEYMYTIAISNPAELNAERWYFGVIGFSKHREVSSATYELQVQLVGNVRKLRDEYGSIYGKYSAYAKTGLAGWFALNGASDGNDMFNVGAGQQAFYQERFFQVGDRKVHDFVEPALNKGPFFDFAPGYCGFGSDPYGSAPKDDGTNTGDTTTPIRNGIPPAPGLAYGSGTSKPPTDSPKSGKPNFVAKSIKLFDTSGRERYSFKKTEEIKMRGKFSNDGTANIPSDKKVKSMFLLSKGYKEDPHGDWQNVGTDETKSENIRVGDSHEEEEGLKLWERSDIVSGKVYNIVFCADRKERDNNNGGEFAEIHESDNCTSEAAFEVEGTYNFLANLLPLSNNQPGQGETFLYTLGIGNTLDQPGEDVSVALYISPNQDWNGRWLVDSYTIPAASLPTGGSFWRNGTLIAPSPGEYTLWACVNPNGTIPETTGSDNCKSQWFKVKSELNFSLSNLTITKQSFMSGERMMGTVTANTSGGDSAQDVEVSFWTTPRGWEIRTLVDTVVIPAQYMRQSAGPVTWNSNQIPVPVPEDYTLWACINPKGVFPETNGEDNCKTAWFKVIDPNPPTPVPQPEEDEGEEAWMLLLL